MVLEKEYETVARWGIDKWVVQAQPRYRWCDIKKRAISGWYLELNDALQFAVESATR